MNTQEQLIILSEICCQDLKIAKHCENIARLSKDTKEAKDASVDLEGELKSLALKKENDLKKRRELDEKLQTEKSNLRKWESRAEKIKGEREYTALMSEIKAQKRTITGIEIELAEVSDQLKKTDDTLKKTSGAQEEKVEFAELSYGKVKEELAKEKAVLKDSEKIRQELIEKLPKIIKLKYERIYEKRNFQGISFLKEGVCQACMRTVPPELFNRVLKKEVVEQCPSCLRIMVIEQQIESE